MNFISKADHIPLAFRKFTLHFNIILENHFKQLKQQQQQKSVGNMTLNRQQKDTCLQYESWIGKLECGFVPQQLGRYALVTQIFNCPGMSVNDLQSAGSMGLRVINKF